MPEDQLFDGRGQLVVGVSIDRTCPIPSNRWYSPSVARSATSFGAVAIVSDYSVAGTLILITLGAFAGPLGAFLAGMVMFTVREERQAFNERHSPDR